MGEELTENIPINLSINEQTKAQTLVFLKFKEIPDNKDFLKVIEKAIRLKANKCQLLSRHFGRRVSALVFNHEVAGSIPGIITK